MASAAVAVARTREVSLPGGMAPALGAFTLTGRAELEMAPLVKAGMTAAALRLLSPGTDDDVRGLGREVDNTLYRLVMRGEKQPDALRAEVEAIVARSSPGRGHPSSPIMGHEELAGVMRVNPWSAPSVLAALSPPEGDDASRIHLYARTAAGALPLIAWLMTPTPFSPTLPPTAAALQRLSDLANGVAGPAHEAAGPLTATAIACAFAVRIARADASEYDMFLNLPVALCPKTLPHLGRAPESHVIPFSAYGNVRSLRRGDGGDDDQIPSYGDVREFVTGLGASDTQGGPTQMRARAVLCEQMLHALAGATLDKNDLRAPTTATLRTLVGVKRDVDARSRPDGDAAWHAAGYHVDGCLARGIVAATIAGADVELAAVLPPPEASGADGYPEMRWFGSAQRVASAFIDSSAFFNVMVGEAGSAARMAGLHRASEFLRHVAEACAARNPGGAPHPVQSACLMRVRAALGWVEGLELLWSACDKNREATAVLVHALPAPPALLPRHHTGVPAPKTPPPATNPLTLQSLILRAAPFEQRSSPEPATLTKAETRHAPSSATARRTFEAKERGQLALTFGEIDSRSQKLATLDADPPPRAAATLAARPALVPWSLTLDRAGRQPVTLAAAAGIYSPWFSGVEGMAAAAEAGGYDYQDALWSLAVDVTFDPADALHVYGPAALDAAVQSQVDAVNLVPSQESREVPTSAAAWGRSVQRVVRETMRTVGLISLGGGRGAFEILAVQDDVLCAVRAVAQRAEAIATDAIEGVVLPQAAAALVAAPRGDDDDDDVVPVNDDDDDDVVVPVNLIIQMSEEVASFLMRSFVRPQEFRVLAAPEPPLPAGVVVATLPVNQAARDASSWLQRCRSEVARVAREHVEAAQPPGTAARRVQARAVVSVVWSDKTGADDRARTNIAIARALVDDDGLEEEYVLFMRDGAMEQGLVQKWAQRLPGPFKQQRPSTLGGTFKPRTSPWALYPRGHDTDVLLAALALLGKEKFERAANAYLASLPESADPLPVDIGLATLAALHEGDIDEWKKLEKLVVVVGSRAGEWGAGEKKVIIFNDAPVDAINEFFTEHAEAAVGALYRTRVVVAIAAPVGGAGRALLTMTEIDEALHDFVERRQASDGEPEADPIVTLNLSGDVLAHIFGRQDWEIPRKRRHGLIEAASAAAAMLRDMLPPPDE